MIIHVHFGVHKLSCSCEIMCSFSHMVLCLKRCPATAAILNFLSTHKYRCSWNFHPSLLSNGSVVSEEKNFQIFFTQGPTVRWNFVLWWWLSWISDRQNKSNTFRKITKYHIDRPRIKKTSSFLKRFISAYKSGKSMY